jgi:predicted TIM-barrel fold metal-dependent hydrolase
LEIPVILDGHIHIRDEAVAPRPLLARMAAAGVAGGLLISRPPQAYAAGTETSTGDAARRLEQALAWCDGSEHLYPFFWIDPTDHDARTQVERAAEAGIAGFKTICSSFLPSDDEAMPTFRAVAATGKPMLFHSGILWDGKPSGPFNRPCNFECLLEVDGLRFALAHISWPWVDECIAVYGKFLNAKTRRPDLSCEMFIDLTPGTPPIYRRDALTKLHTVGYDVASNLIFGTDCNTAAYNAKWTLEWLDRDNAIYDELGLGDDTRRRIYADNLLRFVGASDEAVVHRMPKPGE